MSEIPNRPNPLSQYSVINTTNLTVSSTISGSSLKVDALTIDSGNITGCGTLTGSSIVVSGPSGSINFSSLYGGSGSAAIATDLALVVTVTGSTYRIPLYT
jgi:hypothetical protein